MPLTVDEAAVLLRVPRTATKRDVLSAFRCRIREVHPDLGADEGADLHRFTQARDLLLEDLARSHWSA